MSATDRRQRDSHPLLSVEEAAELLGQSRSSLYRAIQRHDVPPPCSASAAATGSPATPSSSSCGDEPVRPSC